MLLTGVLTGDELLSTGVFVPNGRNRYLRVMGSSLGEAMAALNCCIVANPGIYGISSCL